MISQAYNSRKKPCVLVLEVYADKKTRVHLVASDADRRNTKYMDRFHTFKGNKRFVIRLPQSPNKVVVTVKPNTGGSVKMISKKVMPLQTQMNEWSFQNRRIGKFVNFTQQFSDIAGYLSTGKYYDDSGLYEIEYLPIIKSDQTKMPLNTPARINSESGRVQVSKKHFQDYTIPGRVAILLHEFCHVFANNDKHSELEADFHAAVIYCSLGYPRVEILNVFANVFYKADTDLNRLRLNKLREFVDRFDNNVESVKYGL